GRTPRREGGERSRRGGPSFSRQGAADHVLGARVSMMSANPEARLWNVRAAATVDKPVLVILGGRGRASVAALRELLSFREVLWAFAVRFVKVKYKQAAIGIGWALLQPLLLAALFA